MCNQVYDRKMVVGKQHSGLAVEMQRFGVCPIHIHNDGVVDVVIKATFATQNQLKQQTAFWLI